MSHDARNIIKAVSWHKLEADMQFLTDCKASFFDCSCSDQIIVVQAKLYDECKKAGITMLSIAHRPALKKFHNMVIHFDGSQAGQGWRLEQIEHD